MHCYVKVVYTEINFSIYIYITTVYGIIHNFSLLYNCTKSTLGGGGQICMYAVCLKNIDIATSKYTFREKRVLFICAENCE